MKNKFAHSPSECPGVINGTCFKKHNEKIQEKEI